MGFVSGGMGRRGRCDTKTPYHSKQAAEAARERIIARGGYGPAIQVYPCRRADNSIKHWHTARAMEKGRKPRRRK